MYVCMLVCMYVCMYVGQLPRSLGLRHYSIVAKTTPALPGLSRSVEGMKAEGGSGVYTGLM